VETHQIAGFFVCAMTSKLLQAINGKCIWWFIWYGNKCWQVI